MRLCNNSFGKTTISEHLFLFRSIKERFTTVKCSFSSENAPPKEEKVKDKVKKLTKREAMLQYLSSMPADVQENLFKTRKGLGDYQNGFVYLTKSYAISNGVNIDKLMLINPSTAARIAKSIVQHSAVLNSEENQNKVVYDTDGMLCLTSMQLRKQLQAKNIKSEITIVSASDYMKNIYPNKLLKELDIGVSPGLASVARMKHELKLFGYELATCLHPFMNRPEFSAWENPEPSYVYVGMASYNTVNTFSKMYLLRLSNDTIFAKNRPEFFLLMDPTSFFRLHFNIPEIHRTSNGIVVNESETKTHMLKEVQNVSRISVKQKNFVKSIMFRLFFDAKLVDLLPAKDFFPWRTKYDEKNNRSGGSRADIIRKFENDIALVHLTPKIDPGIPLDKPEHLQYFLTGLSERQNHLINPVMYVFEKWLPGFGLELIRRGYDPCTTLMELRIEDIRCLYNLLINHPEVKNSNFEATSVTEEFYKNISKRSR